MSCLLYFVMLCSIRTCTIYPYNLLIYKNNKLVVWFRLRLLNVFEPCTLQVGDRNFYTLTEKDTVTTKEQWRRTQKANVITQCATVLPPPQPTTGTKRRTKRRDYRPSTKSLQGRTSLLFTIITILYYEWTSSDQVINPGDRPVTNLFLSYPACSYLNSIIWTGNPGKYLQNLNCSEVFPGTF